MHIPFYKTHFLCVSGTAKTQPIHTAPLLLSPESILQTNELHHTNILPIIISKYPVYSERRPSFVKFSCDNQQSTKDIFYDAHSNISISPTSPSSKNSFSSNKKRRPSFRSNISSVKTTTISIHYHSNQPLSKQGIVLCCSIRKSVNRHSPIKWKEYYAIISPSNYLQLYPICNCDVDQRNVGLPL